MKTMIETVRKISRSLPMVGISEIRQQEKGVTFETASGAEVSLSVSPEGIVTCSELPKTEPHRSPLEKALRDMFSIAA